MWDSSLKGINIWCIFNNNLNGHQRNILVIVHLRKRLERYAKHYVFREGCLMRMLGSRCVRVIMVQTGRNYRLHIMIIIVIVGQKKFLQKLLQR